MERKHNKKHTGLEMKHTKLDRGRTKEGRHGRKKARYAEKAALVLDQLFSLKMKDQNLTFALH